MAQRLNDEQLEVISKALVPLFDDLEQAVIIDVARRVNKTLSYTRTAELQVMELQKLGYSPNKIRTEVLKTLRADKEFASLVERNTREYKKEVKEIIADIVENAKKEGNKIVAESGEMSWIDDMRVWESNGIQLTDDSFLPVLVNAIQRQIGDGIVNLSQTMGFKGINGFESVENLYRDELNKALIKVSSGTFTADTVVKEVVHNLAKSGLRTIDYASGRTMQMDSAVRLAVRTGCSQLSAKMTDENIERTEQNLVQVSSHWGARNKGEGIENHEEWQGKIYYIRNEHDYSEEAKRIGQDSIEDLWEKTGYSVDGAHTNNPLGLYGFNCRHRLYPFFEGISEPIKFEPEPSPIEVDGKIYDYYAQSQKLRQMERKIRNLKREREAISKFSREQEDLAKIDAKISKADREYREWCHDFNTKPSSANIRYEVGSGDLKKTEAFKEYSNAREKIIESPNIFETGITKGNEYVLKLLKKKNINSPVFNKVISYIENDKFYPNKKMASKFGYNPKTFDFRYNPLKMMPKDYIDVRSRIHEGVHKFDYLYVKSYNDNDFINSIIGYKSFALDNIKVISKRANSKKNMYLADIISAITIGKANPYIISGHSEEYWDAETIPVEVFSNMTVLQWFNPNDYDYIKKMFPELEKNYRRLYGLYQ